MHEQMNPPAGGQNQINQTPQPPVEVLPAKPHHHIKTWLALGIILLAAVAVGCWAWNESQKDNNAPQPPLNLRGGEGELSNWQTYRSEVYGFEIKYPSDWAVENQNNNSDGSFSFEIVSRSRTESPIKLTVKNTPPNRYEMHNIVGPSSVIHDQILSTFKFIDSTRTLDELVAEYRAAHDAKDINALMNLVYMKGVDEAVKNSLVTNFTIDTALAIDLIEFFDPEQGEVYEYERSGIKYSINSPVVKVMKVNYMKNPSGLTGTSYNIGIVNGRYYFVTATPEE